MQLFLEGLFDDRYGAPGRHDIYCCKNCGFGRTVPGLDQTRVGEFYAKHYPLAKSSPEAVSKAARVPALIKAWLNGTDNTAHWHIKKGAKVLDIGSGSGVSLLEIASLGGEAFGVEPDPNATKLAKKLKLKVYTGFIEDNPFKGERFDFVTASQVIEHSPDPKQFLEAAVARLKNGGQVILSFPNLEALYRRLCGRRWLHWHIPYHYNFFTIKSFLSLANQVGLKVVKVRTITPNLWTLIQLKGLLETPKEGKMGKIWAAQHSSSPTRKNHPVLVNVVNQLLKQMLSGFVLVTNRIIDWLGQGESFLVWLKKDG